MTDRDPTAAPSPWTPERFIELRRHEASHRSNDDIWRALNLLPGTPIKSLDAIQTMRSRMRKIINAGQAWPPSPGWLSRYNADVAASATATAGLPGWSPERTAIVEAHVRGTNWTGVLERVNALPGPALTPGAIRSHFYNRAARANREARANCAERLPAISNSRAHSVSDSVPQPKWTPDQHVPMTGDEIRDWLTANRFSVGDNVTDEDALRRANEKRLAAYVPPIKLVRRAAAGRLSFHSVRSA